MANPPPPYSDITGISRAVMKDNAQETLANYNGNARPGELVVDLTQDPPPLYVGNNAGQLTAITSGGIAGLPLANGTSNFNIAAINSNVTITAAGTETWVFDTSGSLTFPGGDGTIYQSGDHLVIECSDEDVIIRSNNDDVRLEADDDVQIRSGYDSGNATFVGQWTFDQAGRLQNTPVTSGVSYTEGHIQFVGNSSGDGNGYTTLELVPDETVTVTDQYIIIDPTAGGHIHIRAGGTQDNSGADLILGGENSSFRVNAGSNAAVQVTANSHIWSFEPGGYATVPVTDVANLVPANSIGVGARGFVTDADTQTFANTAVGGGANAVPVYSDGTVWRVG